MLFNSPDDDVLFDALIARDARYDGRAYVGGSSTGVFYRVVAQAKAD